MTEVPKFIPEESQKAKPLFQKEMKIEAGKSTIGDIATLGFKSSKWLDDTLRNPVEKNTYKVPKDISKPSEFEAVRRWGEPRMGDVYKLEKFDGEYQFYRTRNGETIYMIIPPEQIKIDDGVKKIAEATQGELQQLSNSITA